MERSLLEKMNTCRPGTFPKNLTELKRFLVEKGMDAVALDDITLQKIVEKVNAKEPLGAGEISAVHRALDLGDTCGCDSDHRIRDRQNDGKKIGYSAT